MMIVAVLRVHEVRELLRSFSDCIQTGDESAHAGSRDVIDGNVMIFEALQHANMGQS